MSEEKIQAVTMLIDLTLPDIGMLFRGVSYGADRLSERECLNLVNGGWAVPVEIREEAAQPVQKRKRATYGRSAYPAK